MIVNELVALIQSYYFTSIHENYHFTHIHTENSVTPNHQTYTPTNNICKTHKLITMEALAFKIVEFSEASQREGEIVVIGIVKDVYDTIYPQTETGIAEMPYEVELRHFKVNGYKLIYFQFDITYTDCEKLRTSKFNF